MSIKSFTRKKKKTNNKVTRDRPWANVMFHWPCETHGDWAKNLYGLEPSVLYLNGQQWNNPHLSCCTRLKADPVTVPQITATMKTNRHNEKVVKLVGFSLKIPRCWMEIRGYSCPVILDGTAGADPLTTGRGMRRPRWAFIYYSAPRQRKVLFHRRQGCTGQNSAHAFVATENSSTKERLLSLNSWVGSAQQGWLIISKIKYHAVCLPALNYNLVLRQKIKTTIEFVFNVLGKPWIFHGFKMSPPWWKEAFKPMISQ